jgi:hypothetical protein
MCRRIPIVDPQRRFVVRDRVVENAVLEQQVAHVHDGRNAARVGIERVAQGLERGGRSAALAKERQRPFIVDERALGGRRGFA